MIAPTRTANLVRKNHIPGGRWSCDVYVALMSNTFRLGTFINQQSRLNSAVFERHLAWGVLQLQAKGIDFIPDDWFLWQDFCLAALRMGFFIAFSRFRILARLSRLGLWYRKQIQRQSFQERINFRSESHPVIWVLTSWPSASVRAAINSNFAGA